MTRSVLLLLLGLGIVVSAPAAGSEQRREAAIVGILFVSAGADDPVIQALRRGLRDRGYVEGRDLRIVHRSAGGQLAKLPELAEELVRLKVDVIVTGAHGSTHAAQQATKTIPIVANFYEQDPVASGFIDSFNHPNGNITGIYTRNELLAEKRLELLKEVLPRLSRVAVLFDAQGSPQLDQLKPAARALHVELQPIELKAPYEFDSLFATAKKQKVGAVIVLPSPELYVNSARIGAAALASGLPLLGETRDLTDAGGLMSYSTDLRDVFYRLAHLIDHLLKGAKVNQLPVDQTEHIKLVVNLRTAKALGLAIPESILIRADEVVR